MLTILLASMLMLAFSVQSIEKRGIISNVADGLADFGGEFGGFKAQSGSVDWWPMFQHDLRHLGYSTSKAPKTNETLWTYTAGGPSACASPTVAEGRVYFGSDDNKVYCLNASSGAFIWSYTTANLVRSAPAIADGRVYTGCYNGRIYCLNATTGALIWITGYLSNYFPGSPVVNDDRVYIGGVDNWKFFCLNATTGATLWTYNTNGGVYVCSPAVADGFVYFADGGGHKVYCLNSTTGTFKWSYTLGNGGSTSAPAVVNGTVYLGSFDNRVIALNASTGVLIWSYTTGEGVVASSPAVVDGKLYIGCNDDKVYCLNSTSGSFIWSYKTGNDVYSSPAVADGKVYITSGDNYFYCLNATSGALIWSYTGAFAGVSNSPAIANGIVYVCTYKTALPSKLIAFGSHDVAVTNATPSTTEPYPRQTVDITVVAKNDGTFNETFDVSTYYDSTLIGTQTVTDLPPEEEKTLVFSWNTTDIAGGYYTISANASIVPGETDIADNTFTDGTVKLTSPLKIMEVIPTNRTGYPKNTFQVGTMAFFKVTVNSTDLIPQNTLITINLYDNASITIGIASFQGPILPGISTIIFGIPITTTATIGTATIYANCYTDWPSQGGFPHCPEKSATLEITGP